MLVNETIGMESGNFLLSAMNQRFAAKGVYRAGLYLRLSRDYSNGSSESMSIRSQKTMLVDYAEEHGYEVTDIYIEACDIITQTGESA